MRLLPVRLFLVKDLVLLACAIGIFFSVTLGMRPYATPSEARYVEIGREMAATGDWVTPRLNGVKYFEKPPLFYWLEAAHLKLFGLGEFSGRFWTMALMLGLCLVTYAAAARLFGRKCGLLSGGLLATSVLGFSLSRIVLLDVPVSLFIDCCLFAFILATHEPPGARREWLFAAMYVSAALAVLTKGLIGMALPGLVIGVWILLTGNWQLLREARLVRGLCLFLVITVPWHALAAANTPEFLHFYFIHEHVERFLTTTHHRNQPWWFFGLVVLAGFLPWSFFLQQAFRGSLKEAWNARHGDGVLLFLLLWIVLLFLFFSSSHSKLIPYILPIFPPCAIILGRYFVRIIDLPVDKSFNRGVIALITLNISLLAAATFAWPKLVAKDAMFADFNGIINLYEVFLAFSSLALILILLRKMPPKIVLLALFFYAFVQLIIVDIGISCYKRDSVKEFAEILRTQPVDNNDEVAVFHHYYQDLPVYFNRNVTTVSAAGELTFGVSIEPATTQWMIDDDEFWRRWRQPHHRMYMVIEKKELQKLTWPRGAQYHLLADNARNVLLVNKEKP